MIIVAFGLLIYIKPAVSPEYRAALEECEKSSPKSLTRVLRNEVIEIKIDKDGKSCLSVAEEASKALPVKK